MTAQHTPGPWRIASNMRGIGNAAVAGIEDQNGRAIANCGSDGEYNARHIVSCVNSHAILLDAIQDLWIALQLSEHMDTARSKAEQAIWTAKARDAIAKALGNQ
jgi:hypothetical protein